MDSAKWNDCGWMGRVAEVCVRRLRGQFWVGQESLAAWYKGTGPLYLLMGIDPRKFTALSQRNQKSFAEAKIDGFTPSSQSRFLVLKGLMLTRMNPGW